MAMFGKREPRDPALPAAAGTPRDVDPPTETRHAPLAIPPLLTDGPADEVPVTGGAATDEVLLAETVGSMGVAPDPGAPNDPVLPEVPGESASDDASGSSEAATAVTAAVEDAAEPFVAETATDVPATDVKADDSAPANGAQATRDRLVDAAQATRDRAAEGAGAARERAAEHAAAAREKLSESAGEARERLSEGAAEAKIRGAKMGKRLARGASDAREKVSSAAGEARDRAADVDMSEFAHSTTRIIDQARPFFLAGFAIVFAVLGFVEGDSSTAQLFVVGAVLFVIGAAFSSEINLFITHRLTHRPAPSDTPDDHDD